MNRYLDTALLAVSLVCSLAIDGAYAQTVVRQEGEETWVGVGGDYELHAQSISVAPAHPGLYTAFVRKLAPGANAAYAYRRVYVQCTPRLWGGSPDWLKNVDSDNAFQTSVVHEICGRRRQAAGALIQPPYATGNSAEPQGQGQR